MIRNEQKNSTTQFQLQNCFKTLKDIISDAYKVYIRGILKCRLQPENTSLDTFNDGFEIAQRFTAGKLGI